MSNPSDRLDKMEEMARELTREIQALKAERNLAAMRAASAAAPRAHDVEATKASVESFVSPHNVPPYSAPPLNIPPRQPPPPRAPPPARRKSFFERNDMEKLVGRYGALALGVITTVMGVGALVSWALRAGYLVPWVRIGMGVALAVGIAAGGWRLRNSGARAFGNTLLALALAVIQVVAWGAGPRLNLVPSWSAILVADMASGALVWLALREAHQTLFAVGFGGALLAPFVMSTGQGQRPVLAGYGIALLGAGMRALGPRAWRGALALLLLSTAVYVFALIGHQGAYPWFNRELPALFAMAVTAFALLTAEAPNRQWIGLTAMASLAMALSQGASSAAIDVGQPHTLAVYLPLMDVPIAAYLGTILFFVVARELEGASQLAVWLLPVLLVPWFYLMSPLTLTQFGRYGDQLMTGVFVLAWALLHGVVSFTTHSMRRGVLLAVAGLLTVGAIQLMLHDMPWAIVPLLAANAVTFALVARKEAQPVTLLAAGGSLLMAFSETATQLAAFTGYRPMPFLSTTSLAGALTVAATYVVLRTALPMLDTLLGERSPTKRMIVLVTCVLAFLWGRVELSHAISRDASTFLLIMYHAAWGVAAIRVGRGTSERLRQVGLALAVYAALWAVVGAWNVQQIVLRVGTYLGAGAFLMGVAWFYRQRDTPAEEPKETPKEAPAAS